MLSRLLVMALVLLAVATSCGGPAKQTSTEAPRSTTTDIGDAARFVLVVDRIVDGWVLGQRLSDPFSLAIDFAGTVYLTDRGNHRIIRFDQNLAPVSDAGGFGGAEGLFSRPGYIAIDRELNLLVSDPGNRRIARLNSRLLYVDELAFYDDEEPLRFGEPAGVAVNSLGAVWVGDSDLDRIAVFSNVGSFDRLVADFGYGGGQLEDPAKIVATVDNQFVVCDAGNGRLAVYDEYGNYRRDLRYDPMQYPVAIAEDGDFWWILDGSSGDVIAVDRSGTIISGDGTGILGLDRPLAQPSDLAVLADGRVIIADSGNNRLVVCQVIEE